MAPKVAEAPQAPEQAPQAPTPEQVVKDLLAFKGRAPTFKRDARYVEADVLSPEGHPEGTVTRGTRLNGAQEGAQEYLFHKHGREQGVPVAVVSFAILEGVITDAEIAALVEARKRKLAQV